MTGTARTTLASLVLLAATCHGATGGHTRDNYIRETPAPSTHTLNEDDPGWDCRTMGNGDCGPHTDTSTCGPIGNPLGCPTWEGK